MVIIAKYLVRLLFFSFCLVSSNTEQQKLNHGHLNVIKKISTSVQRLKEVMALTGLYFYFFNEYLHKYSKFISLQQKYIVLYVSISFIMSNQPKWHSFN